MSKPLTSHEMMFRTLITDLVGNKNISDKEREFRLVNFWNQAEYYYDVFCESIYILMTDDSVDALSIDNSGYARFDIVSWEDDFCTGFELLTKEDMRQDVDDIIVYVDLALSRLKNRLNKEGMTSGSGVHRRVSIF